MPHASISESHISPELVLLPIHATSKQKKQLFELLKNQQMSPDKFIFMIDNSNNSYKITQLEQTSQSYEYISSLSSTCSTSGSSHEEESITEAANDDKQEREYEIQNKSELSSLSTSFIEKSQQLKQLGQMRDQKQIHYMLAGAALVMISAALLYKYKPLFS